MKRMILMTAASVTALGLAACSKPAEQEAAPADTASAAAEAAPAASDAASAGAADAAAASDAPQATASEDNGQGGGTGRGPG